MTTDTIKPKPCDRYVLFDLAKQIYALHCAIVQLANIPSRSAYREELIKLLLDLIEKFKSCGGIVEEERDFLGDTIPLLSYPDPKEEIQYDVGKFGCIQLTSNYPPEQP